MDQDNYGHSENYGVYVPEYLVVYNPVSKGLTMSYFEVDGSWD